VVRLSGRDPAASAAALTVELENVEGRNETRELDVSWALTPMEAHAQMRGLPAKVVTEIAGYGVAAVLMAQYTRFRIVLPARYGDRFDFWLERGDEQGGLEVGAAASGSLEGLYTEKRNQLVDNPHGLAGFVVVTIFDRKRARLSFHQ